MKTPEEVCSEYQASRQRQRVNNTLTKREQFALAALPAVLADLGSNTSTQIIVKVTLRYADALIGALTDQAEFCERECPF
jgi:hypothetical protein